MTFCVIFLKKVLQNVLCSDTISSVVGNFTQYRIPVRRSVIDMAKCAVCEKGAHFGNAVSHSHRRSNKIWNSNVKSVRVKVNGATKKMYVCTSCLRSGKVERA